MENPRPSGASSFPPTSCGREGAPLRGAFDQAMGMLAYPEVLQYRHRDLATCLISKSSLEYRLAVRVACVYGVTLSKKVEVRKP